MKSGLIDMPVDSANAYDDLMRVSLGTAQILMDMANGSSDVGPATKAALGMLGSELYDVAWEAREHDELMTAGKTECHSRA